MVKDLAIRPLAVDAVVVLTVYIALLMCIPANLTVRPLGAAGTPAQLIGLVAGAWWLGVQLDRSRSNRAPSEPIRLAMTIFVICVLISYLVATTRALDPLELSAADRGVLQIGSWLGILLLVSDGIPSARRLDVLLRRLVMAGGFVASLGIAQFITGQAIIDRISIPGLSPNTVLTSVYDRNGFARTASTATHPIEFGVLLAIILPLALHFAFRDVERNAVARWYPVVVIAVAVPMTVSRSSLLAVAVVMAILMPTWDRPRRRKAYVAIFGLLLVVYVAIPGMLGTLTRLFTGISDDGSALSRTDSYAIAFQFVERSPVFGRGLSTFLPGYRILDDQYLGFVIELGVVGLLSFLALMLTGICVARRVRRSLRTLDPDRADLAHALCAGIAACAISFATFDAFGFPIVAGLTFFLLGAVGALNRLVRLGLVPDGSTNPTRGIDRSSSANCQGASR